MHEIRRSLWALATTAFLVSGCEANVSAPQDDSVTAEPSFSHVTATPPLAYVGTGPVSVIATASNTVITTVNAGSSTLDMAITPDGALRLRDEFHLSWHGIGDRNGEQLRGGHDRRR